MRVATTPIELLEPNSEQPQLTRICARGSARGDYPCPRERITFTNGRATIHFEFSRKFIADRDPDRSVALEQTVELGELPVEVVAVGILMVVRAILVPDLERRIGERKIDAFGPKWSHSIDAITDAGFVRWN